jgi:L-rhamnose 1-dehydrogenase
MTTRVVLVTGASRGIGRAIAAAFGAEGNRVVVNHPGEPDDAAETARLVSDAGGEPLVIDADVADAEAAVRMVEAVENTWGSVEVLVNNAGLCPHVEFFDVDLELWDRVHRVNLRGAFVITQRVTRTMVEQAIPGRVISVSSISAWVGGALQTHYCPTKAGLSSLMKSLAIVLGPHGITCNAVLPGVIHTDINRADMTRPERRAYVEGRIPLGRLGEPSDVAGVVTLLARPEAAYMNGSEVLVDGGMLVNLL